MTETFWSLGFWSLVLICHLVLVIWNFIFVTCFPSDLFPKLCYYKDMPWLPKPSLLTVSLAVSLIFLGYMTLSDQGLFRLYQLFQTEDMAIENNEEFRQEIVVLKQEVKELHKLPHLERVIRKELGFLKPNEIIYYVGTNEE